jgi:hypothetical protein
VTVLERGFYNGEIPYHPRRIDTEAHADDASAVVGGIVESFRNLGISEVCCDRHHPAPAGEAGYAKRVVDLGADDTRAGRAMVANWAAVIRVRDGAVGYLERGPRDADETITQLIAVLDTQDLALAIERLEKGYGLRLVK